MLAISETDLALLRESSGLLGSSAPRIAAARMYGEFAKLPGAERLMYAPHARILSMTKLIKFLIRELRATPVDTGRVEAVFRNIGVSHARAGLRLSLLSEGSEIFARSLATVAIEAGHDWRPDHSLVWEGLIKQGVEIQKWAFVEGAVELLTENACGTFRNVPDQPHVIDAESGSVWLHGLGGQTLVFPCAHAEGRFVFREMTSWVPALRYPPGANPDGSMDDIAGIATSDRLVLGLMNHPERAIERPANLTIFENGVRAVRT